MDRLEEAALAREERLKDAGAAALSQANAGQIERGE